MEEVWHTYTGEDNFLTSSDDIVHLRIASNVTSIPNLPLYKNLKIIDLSAVKETITFGNYAFNNCPLLEHIIDSTKITAIGSCAFFHCAKLKEIDLVNVATIGWGAFSDCLSLECIAIPSRVIKLTPHTFSRCKKLKKVDLNDGLQFDGEGIFRECTSLERIVIPPSVLFIHEYMFHGCRKLKEVKMSEGIQVIYFGAFMSCASLESIKIPSTVKELDEHAFRCCTSLKQVKIPPAVTKIGPYVFEGCKKIQEVQLCEGISTIGTGAFQGCTSMERVSVPSTITVVGDDAFDECTALKEVELKEGIQELKENAFANCPLLLQIEIPTTAFVIEWSGGNLRCYLMQYSAICPKSSRMVVSSKILQHMNTSQLRRIENRINEIIGRNKLRDKEKFVCIRELIVYHELVDATTILELAVWKAHMARAVAKVMGSDARQACRKKCGSDIHVIMEGVLRFFSYNK